MTTLTVNLSESVKVGEVVGKAPGRAGIQLDIGCGANKQGDGWVGIDFQPLPGVDIVHDLMSIPWPLEDESVLRAIASHVVEHIPPHNLGFVKFMNEVWRIMMPDCEFAIVTPHGWSAGYLQDPTHCNPCNEHTWLYFVKDHPLWQFYKPLPWRVKYLAFDPALSIEVVLTKQMLHDDY